MRDADRQKMSKTKGNVVDPIEVIEKFGTDAVRFTLAAMAAPGTDIAFSESRTESYRAFANKIWNAARFLFMNVDRARAAGLWSLSEFATPADGQPLPKGSVGPGLAGLRGGDAGRPLDSLALQSRGRRSRRGADEYRFHEAAHVVYHFFWGEYCDWYVELIKPRLLDRRSRGGAGSLRQPGAAIFEGALRMLAPFMPFITEEIWHAVYDGKPPLQSIALAAYPQCDPAQLDPDGREPRWRSCRT